jgi:beta-glucosidase
MPFPKDFLWGVAASSYQIEGAAREDGRGECIWTRFSHTPGKVKNGDTGDIANDHYHRYKDDIALIKRLGMPSYRLSIAWPRIMPAGTGAINPPGLDFYDRLIDEMLAAQILPYVTLYHWDLPQALQDRGGWTNPDSPQWFADYAGVVTGRLGDRVKHWITHNEPWCSAFLGYMFGAHAPGLRDPKQAFAAAHHLLISHGLAVPVIRAHSADSKVGITLNLVPHVPATNDPFDIANARRADTLSNDWFLDPVFKGHYPAWGVETFAADLEGLDLSAAKVAAVPTDFLGVNYYMRWVHGHKPAETPGAPPIEQNSFPADAEFTDMGWEIYPCGLYDMLHRVHRDYGPIPLYITENGAAFPEPETVTGDILEDPKRVAYYKGYLEAAEQAIAEGVPLRGYFAWSLMDNFEWAEGYSKRFGIVHVDYATQKRTPKRSALYLQRVAQTGIL